ncbi:MAG: glycosyltransferase family 2 protein [Clostridia bacterium]|nr:glycosyltransferase family 2 protein [Clostridia bacterium]
MKTVFIIRAYNEEGSIARVVDALRKNYPQYDYVVVDDGSTDATAEICRKNGYNYVSHPVNLGLEGAFRTGMMYAAENGYDAAVQFDGDGQHNPEYVAGMLALTEEGNDIVIGSRFLTEKKPHTLRMLGSRLITLAIKLTTFKRITDPTSGLRVYNRKTILRFAESTALGPEPDTVALLMRKGVKVTETQVSMNERYAGKSYFTILSSMKYMTHMFVSILLLQWFRRV